MTRLMVAYGLDQGVVSMVYVVLSWVSAQQGSVLGAVGVLGVSAILKMVVLMAMGGLADRLGRSAVLVRTIDVRVVLLALLALAIGANAPVFVLVIWATAYGIVDGLHEPTFQALSIDVAARDRQTSTQGWMDTLKRCCTIGGYPVAGAVIGATGTTSWVLGAAGVLLLACRVLLPRVEGGVSDHETGASLVMAAFAHTMQGWRKLWQFAALRGKLGLFAVANFALTPPVVAGIPLFAVEHDWESWQFGITTGLYWFGSLVSGIVMGKWGDKVREKVLVALATLLPTALGTAAFGAFGGEWRVANVILLATGLFSGLGPTLLTGAMKRNAPGDLVTQVMAARSLAILSAAPIGYAVMSAAPSVSWAIVALGLGLAVIVALLLVLRPKSLFSTRRVDAGAEPSVDSPADSLGKEVRRRDT